ncbi:hypothetical protein LINPERHAP2_LOCUS8301 [Linum perenne]
MPSFLQMTSWGVRRSNTGVVNLLLIQLISVASLTFLSRDLGSRGVVITRSQGLTEPL